MDKPFIVVTSYFEHPNTITSSGHKKEPESVRWLVDQTEWDYVIYSPMYEPPNYIPKDKVIWIPDKGYDAFGLLTYLVDNYHRLPSHVAFIHGHLNGWHQDRDIITALREYDGRDYFSLNDRKQRNTFYDGCGQVPEHAWGSAELNWNWARDGLREINPDYPIPNRLEFTCCTQFVVTRERILANSLNFYRRCLNWLVRTNKEDFITGRVIEHNVHYMMTHKEIEEP